VVIGTIKGDLHDIGKNLVASMLEGGGFEVIDLGADVPPQVFVEAARIHNADIVALSALLTVTMPSMKATIDAFEAAGARARVKIIVGGAPVTQRYADSIGADGYSDSASSAVALARQLVTPCVSN
jgi:5-methyltetrahydrofolate--homocysteine methyltransferase